MKRLLLLLLLGIVLGPVARSQVDLMLQYHFAQPQGKMGTYAGAAHGLNAQALYRIPKTRLALGANIGISEYGFQSTRQTYRFADGSTTVTDVDVSNDFATFNLSAQLDLLPAGTLTPYLVGQAGYNLYWTGLYIADPRDEDGCKPLENKTLLSDGAFSVGGGAGVRWDLSSLIKKASKERFYVDFSTQYAQGGTVRYMNVNIPPDPDPVSHHHTGSGTTDAVPYSTQFINPQSRVVHEHHVGDVYQSPIQLLSFRLGVVYRLSPRL